MKTKSFIFFVMLLLSNYHLNSMYNRVTKKTIFAKNRLKHSMKNDKNTKDQLQDLPTTGMCDPEITTEILSNQLIEKTPAKKNYSYEQLTYQDLPLATWYMIIDYSKNLAHNLYVTSSFFNFLELNYYQSLSGKILLNNIVHSKYHIQEFSKAKYMKPDPQGFLVDTFPVGVQEQLNIHYDNNFPLFFLKYAHPADFYYLIFHFNKTGHPLLKNDIQVTEEKALDNTPCKHIVFSVKNTDQKTIMLQQKITPDIFKKLLTTYKYNKIVRVLLNYDDEFPFDLKDKEVLNKLEKIIIQNMHGKTPSLRKNIKDYEAILTYHENKMNRKYKKKSRQFLMKDIKGNYYILDMMDSIKNGKKTKKQNVINRQAMFTMNKTIRFQ